MKRGKITLVDRNTEGKWVERKLHGEMLELLAFGLSDVHAWSVPPILHTSVHNFCVEVCL